MGAIVGGFIMPHEPGIFYMPKAKWTDGQRRVMAAYDAIREAIGRLEASTVIVVGADHYVLFGPGCLPAYLIGIGDVTGPYEKFDGIAQDSIPNRPELARYIRDFGARHGFDWASAKAIRVDHSIGIPARVCALPNTCVKGVIPVYLASGVEPFIGLRRAHALGGLIRQAVEAWPQDERVVVIGSGGISHWIGLPEMGKVNEDFDRKVLDALIAGDAEPMLAMSDAEILEQGGNGGSEIRNFVCAMGALPGCKAREILYTHGPEWMAGLGFAEIMVRA